MITKHFKPPTWARPQSWADDAAFDEVVVKNSYQLPAQMAGWTCIDIGGHVGSFVYAALERNAERVIVFEADQRNFEQLLSNINAHPRRDRVHAFNLAVWRSDKPSTELTVCGFPTVGHNTGCGSVAAVVNGPNFGPASAVKTISLADIVAPLDTVDFLKIDCEGAEFPILFTAPTNTLKKIQRIAGELHTDMFWKGDSVVHGHGVYHEKSMEKFLHTHGFTTRTQEQLPIVNRPLLFAIKE